MKVDEVEAARIAALANLGFEEEAVPRLAKQLSVILDYMDRLDSLDTSGVEPTFHAPENAMTLREDAVEPGIGAEEATLGAPGPIPGKFVVPKVIG